MVVEMRFRPALTRCRGEGEVLDRRDAEERHGDAALPKRDARMAKLSMARRSCEDVEERRSGGERYASSSLLLLASLSLFYFFGLGFWNKRD